MGKRIKLLRSIREMTQEQMADSLGMSRQRYARIENGTNHVTLEILSHIAKLLDVTVHDITCVLDEEPDVAYRCGADEDSVEKVFEMLNLFYANKHMYVRLKSEQEE